MTVRSEPGTAGTTAAIPLEAPAPEPGRTSHAEVIQPISGLMLGLFLVAAPIAVLAVLAVLFVKEKPLSTRTGDERRAREEA